MDLKSISNKELKLALLKNRFNKIITGEQDKNIAQVRRELARREGEKK